MVQSTNNPLAKHFRQPALYAKLPSNGKFWANDALDLPVTGEIPVYPMTTRDEITLRTPDALINGTSVVEVIQSCCPNIKNAWAMPSIDVDSTLIAIRIASYGPTMTISSKCPKCNEEHDYDIDLVKVRDSIQSPDYSTPFNIDDLEIQLHPVTYRQVSESGNTTFEEEKLIQTLANPNLDEEVRKTQYNSHIKRIIDLNITNLTNATKSITTGDGTIVSDARFIKEYYSNVDAMVTRKIQDHLVEFVKVAAIRPVDVACSNCENEFKISLEFDYASFFARGF